MKHTKCSKCGMLSVFGHQPHLSNCVKFNSEILEHVIATTDESPDTIMDLLKIIKHTRDPRHSLLNRLIVIYANTHSLKGKKVIDLFKWLNRQKTLKDLKKGQASRIATPYL